MDSLNIAQHLANGRLLDELATALATTSEGVVATGKKGKVTVTFELSQARPGEPEVIVLEAIKCTPPVKPSRGAYFFALDGELHKADPRQPQMEFHEVGRSNGAVVTVDDRSTVVSVRDVG